MAHVSSLAPVCQQTFFMSRPALQTECLATDALLRRYGIRWPSRGLCCGWAALLLAVSLPDDEDFCSPCMGTAWSGRDRIWQGCFYSGSQGRLCFARVCRSVTAKG